MPSSFLNCKFDQTCSIWLWESTCAGVWLRASRIPPFVTSTTTSPAIDEMVSMMRSPVSCFTLILFRALAVKRSPHVPPSPRSVPLALISSGAVKPMPP